MGEIQPFDRELFDSVRGNQYGHQLYVHSLVAAGQRPISLASSSTSGVLADLSAARANDGDSHSSVQVRLWPTTSTTGNGNGTGTGILTPLNIRADAVQVPALGLGKWRLRPMGSDLAFELSNDGSYAVHVTLNQLLSGTTVGGGNSLSLGRWRLRPTGDDLIVERMNDEGVYIPKMVISDD